MQRRLTGKYLGDNLSEKQQQESKQHRDAQEFQPISVAKVNKMCKYIIAQHDDSDIDEIVGDKNGGQSALAVFTEQLYASVNIIMVGLHLVEVGGRKTEKCYFKSAC